MSDDAYRDDGRGVRALGGARYSESPLGRLNELDEDLDRIRRQVGADARAAGYAAWARDTARRARALSAVRTAEAALEQEITAVGRERADRHLGRVRLRRGYRNRNTRS
jgi:hypothetical protein